MSRYLLLLIPFLVTGCVPEPPDRYLTDYVDPLIGTAPATTISALTHGHGTENYSQVVPFVTAPFGMTNWTPQTRDTEKKCLAPYYYTDTIFQGFRGSHWLSGSCVQDYGSMTIMPVSGQLKYLPGERGSRFSHDQEKSTPYYYQVFLEDYQINAELTATERTGSMRFTFSEEGPAHIIMQPNSDEGEGYIRIIPERNEVVGYNPVHRIYQGWGRPAGFSGYFVARVHRDFEKFGVYTTDTVFNDRKEASGKPGLGGFVSFHIRPGETVEVEIGTSFTSLEHARMNLETESSAGSFDEISSQLKHTWEELLAKIWVEGKNEQDKIKFYTALYHSLLHPRLFNDADGSFVSFAGGEQILDAGDTDYYVDFSMWDTYRALLPLYNLLIPEKSRDMMESLLDKGEQGGWMPIFPCWNSYTSAMIGDHAITAIADACVKGVITLDETDYNLMRKNAFESPDTYQEYEDGKGRRALESYLQYGFVPLEDLVKESFHQNEQVSRTLEYAFDDFALSRVAEKLGKKEDVKILEHRAMNYANVFSRNDSCVRGRHADGSRTAAFNKYEKQSYITEGTPYQYTWYVPHDIAGLGALMGGDEGFNRNLDHFHASGQYWHGNEPGHQIPFLYNYSGQPWKTQQLVSEILETEYGTGPGGLSGNDDAGQMSAWYVFAALGFYPVCPSVPEYVISGPHFDRIILDLGKSTLTINAPGASSGKTYIQDLSINGKNSDDTYFNHFDLIKGGTIDFIMQDTPAKEWGTAIDSRPFSLSPVTPE
ncbi:MAG: GH92 family glycosyl hydrolase [Bacteroidales bacterium]|nr:GH92 family glycosyl hydrolase [Bacteroidales bacterium]